MNQETLLSSGSELANLVVTSDVLHHSWTAICDLHRDTNPNEQPPSLPFSVKHKIYAQQLQPKKPTIIAFETSPSCTIQHLQDGDLVSSATIKETCPLFDFLCTKKNPSFSIHKTAINLFASLHHDLPFLKNQLISSSTLIITGHSLGGSVASLFTLWLLENIDPKTTKHPLCITFGSPLIGDNGLQKSILEHSTWNSCFIHVASDKDPIPRILISPHNAVGLTSTNMDYKPFGTFFLCSESGCACFEDSDSILDLLVAMHLESAGNRDPNEGLQVFDYTNIVEHLKNKILLKGISELSERITNPLRAGLLTQLRTIGFTRSQMQQDIVVKMGERELNAVKRKRIVFNPFEKLNDMKIYMAKLEWYKKESKAQCFGYYDSYKNQWSFRDIEVSKYKKKLTHYWKQMVEEVEGKLQKEGAAFRTRWLYAGTNYRRMVEPLDIADHYKENRLKEYKTQGRSKHYIKLEQWQKDDERPRDDQNNANHERKFACSLTEDSCFWANVEEAISSCNSFNSGDSSPEEKTSSWEKLVEFERYIENLKNDYAVSSEIFFDKSSYMQWWKEFEKIAEEKSYDSSFIDYMKRHEYRRYA